MRSALIYRTTTDPQGQLVPGVGPRFTSLANIHSVRVIDLARYLAAASILVAASIPLNSVTLPN